MSQLGEFFKGADTSLGVFYPLHSMIAIFPDINAALTAERALRRAGFSEDEVLAASGGDLVDLIHEESARKGLFGHLIAELSRFLDTEVAYTDQDLAYAQQGAAVLAVQCVDEHAKTTAWRLIAPESPLVARYYALSGIEHLAGET